MNNDPNAWKQEPCPCGEDTIPGCAARPDRHCPGMEAQHERQIALLEGILDEYEPAFRELAKR